MDNVCNFIPPQPSYGDLHIFHLVYETKKQVFNGWQSLSYYRLLFVLEGEGILHTQSGEYKLFENDVFFCLPSTPYALQSVDNFRYAYIGYLGERANATAEKFKINVTNCVFHGFPFLKEIWKKSVDLPIELSKLYAEGLFSCTLAAIAAQTLCFDNVKAQPQTAAIIKKYIDENFSNPELSLEIMAKELSYSAKYISALFKKEFKMTFKAYLNTLRLNNACALMDKGFTSVTNVASLCGFFDPLYFSKLFKANMRQTPSEYIAIKNAFRNEPKR